MSSGLHRSIICVSAILVASWSVTAADFSEYRDFRLGSSSGDVFTHTEGSGPRDIKTLHERPALLQELAWRPPYRSDRALSERDAAIRGVVFSFINDKLFRIAVDYDGNRTEGLTQQDMIASLSTVYGPVAPLPVQRPHRPGYDALDAPSIVAFWRSGEITVTLQYSSYSSRFGLILTSLPLEVLARKAQADAVTIDAREAPAREAARVKAGAEAALAAAEKTRATNKTTFQP